MRQDISVELRDRDRERKKRHRDREGMKRTLSPNNYREKCFERGMHDVTNTRPSISSQQRGGHVMMSMIDAH